jgi:SAM-dependent methyltransferase
MPGVSFDRAAEYYDATRGYQAGSAERIRDAIVAHTGAGLATRWLELGVGTGRVALPFIRAGYDYTGVDLSQAMMNRLVGNLAEDPGRSGYRFQLYQGDITELPFEDSGFDVIIMVHVLHLVADWQAVLREARRVLRPGGWLLLGYDDGPGEAPSIGAALEPQLVRQHWLELRRELGSDRPPGRSNIWGQDQRAITFLQELGAHIEVVRLAEYERPPISPLGMVERLRERVYSSDWVIPDDLHAEMLRRLDEWFQQTITAPDTPAILTGVFMAIAAKWPGE